MNPEQWLSLKWNDGSTMSDRWLNQSKIIHVFISIISYCYKHCHFAIIPLFFVLRINIYANFGSIFV